MGSACWPAEGAGLPEVLRSCHLISGGGAGPPLGRNNSGSVLVHTPRYWMSQTEEAPLPAAPGSSARQAGGLSRRQAAACHNAQMLRCSRLNALLMCLRGPPGSVGLQ